MGVYIRLNTDVGTGTVRDRFRARIAVGGQVWGLFEGHFYPSSVEIWRNATLKELGGEIIQPIEIDPESRSAALMGAIDGLAKRLPFEDLLYSIILIKGVWHIGKESMVGYISINNAPNWRKMYSDIEIDGETHKEGEDFADTILQSDVMGEPFVREFIKRLSEEKSKLARLTAVYFFEGLFARSEIYNAKSVYYPRIADYVTDLLISYRTELDEQNEKKMLSGLAPYKEAFLVNSLMKNRRFQSALKSDLEQSHILEIKGNSVMFLGEKKDSFREAYKMLKRDVFDKLAVGLRPSEVVRLDIANALGEGQSGIDEV